VREDVKMRRCEDVKMRYRPPLLEEPCAQTLSGNIIYYHIYIYTYIYIHIYIYVKHDIEVNITIYYDSEVGSSFLMNGHDGQVILQLPNVGEALQILNQVIGRITKKTWCVMISHEFS